MGTLDRNREGYPAPTGLSPMPSAYRRLLSRLRSVFLGKPAIVQATDGTPIAAPTPSNDLLTARIAAIAAALVGELSATASRAPPRQDFKLPARLAFTARCCARPNRVRRSSAKRTGRRQWRPIKANEIVAAKSVARRHVWLGARGMKAGLPTVPNIAAPRQPAAREFVLARLAA